MNKVPLVSPVDSSKSSKRTAEIKPSAASLEKAFVASIDSAKNSLKAGNPSAALKASDAAAAIQRQLSVGKIPSRGPSKANDAGGVTVGTGKTKPSDPGLERANVLLGVAKASPTTGVVDPRGTGNVVLGVKRAVDPTAPKGKALTDVRNSGNVAAGGSGGKKAVPQSIIGGRKLNDAGAPKVGGAPMAKAQDAVQKTTHVSQMPYALQMDSQRNLFNAIA